MDEVLQSTTTKVKSPKGFEWLFNMKFDTVSKAIENMNLIEEKFSKAGWTPVLQTRGGFAKKPIEYVEGVVCPECKSRVIKKTSKAGKEFHECEKRVYDFKTKQTTGCTYVNWLDQV